MKNYIIPGVIAVLVVVLGFMFMPRVVNVGAQSGPDHYSMQWFFGSFTKAGIFATSTPTATLIAGNTLNYDTVVVTPTGAAATKTLTFFASSTAAAFIPKAGMSQEVCFINATTTAATTLTFAAGTGIDFEVASSTITDGTPSVIIPADGMGCFKFIRKPATSSTFDIIAAFTRYVDAD